MSIYRLSNNILKIVIEYIPYKDIYNLLLCNKYFNEKIG